MSIDTNNNMSIPMEALKAIDDRTAKVGYQRGERLIQVPVSVGESMADISKVMFYAVRSKDPHTTITASKIEQFLTSLVALRVQQIGDQRLFMPSRDIPVPDFFRPVLTQIGIFESWSKALTVTPTLVDSDTETTGDSGTGAPMQRLSVMSKDEFDEVAFVLKSTGLRFTRGLPHMKAVECDEVYRVLEDEKGNLLVAGNDVSPLGLIVRSVVRMKFLSEMFGAARTRYLSVEDSRAAWEIIVTKGFGDLK